MPATVKPRDPIKKALLIGIGYKELAEREPSRSPLLSAEKDLETMDGLLQEHYGYRPENIEILTDANGSSRLPTKKNMIASMRELVKDARRDDSLVFYFSGHGSQVLAPPDHVEEIDGKDEVLWACDVKTSLDTEPGGTIVDNDVKEILVNHLPAGARLSILLDCCSSGTGADLPFSIIGVSSLTSPIDPQEVNFYGPIHARAPAVPVARQRSRTLFNLNSNAEAPTHIQTPKRRGTFQSMGEWTPEEMDPTEKPTVTCWAACMDSQTTYGNERGSLFLRALKTSLKQNPQSTKAQMLNNITRLLHTEVPWGRLGLTPPEPELSSNLRMDLICHTAFEL